MLLEAGPAHWPCTDREVFALYFQPPGWHQKSQSQVQCLRTRPKLLDELRLEIIPTGWALQEWNAYGLGGPVKCQLCVWQIHLVSHPRDSLLSLFCQRNQSSTHHISTLEPEAYLFQHKILQFLLFIWVTKKFTTSNVIFCSFLLKYSWFTILISAVQQSDSVIHMYMYF